MQDAMVRPGNVDTIHISYYCTHTEKFAETMNQIMEARQIAENPPSKRDKDDKRFKKNMDQVMEALEMGDGVSPAEDDSDEPTFVCEDVTYSVMPYGFSPVSGENPRQCYYKYVLKSEGLTIAIANRECKEDPKARSNPNVRVEVGALPLIWAGSLENLMPQIEQQLVDMGLRIFKNRVARVDMCCDLPFSIRDLQIALVCKQYITRAKKQKIFETIPEVIPGEFGDPEDIQIHQTQTRETGFVIGRDKIMCRGYDKLLKEAFNEDMLIALERRRCGGDLWESMSRIEFQIRRDALRSLAIVGEIDGIKTWQEFVNYQGDIAHYLTHQWLFFTADEFDRTHTKRVRENLDSWHPHWLMVCEAFEEAYGKAKNEVKRFNAPMKRSADEHITQAIGCCQSAIIRTDLNISREDPDWVEQVALFHYLKTKEVLGDVEAKDRFWERWEVKQRRQNNTTPSDAIPVPDDLASVGAGVTHKQPLEAFILAQCTRTGTPQSTPALVH